MSRKKLGKKSAKRKVANSTSFQKLEKDFLNTPSKLASQLDKEVSVLRKKENKLKNTANKIQSKLKLSDKRLQAVANPTSSSEKKQWKLRQKNHAQILKAYETLDKEIQALSQIVESTENQHAKMTALRKHLDQFDKEWSKQSKPAKAKNQSANKKKSAKEVPSHEFQASKVGTFENESADAVDETESVS